MRDFPIFSLSYSEGVVRASVGSRLIAESDGMSFLDFKGERFVVHQKWCRLVGLKGGNKQIKFNWRFPSGHDNWCVGLCFLPEKMEGVVRFYQTVGFNFHMPCRVETQSQNIDNQFLLACAVFFWAYAEKERIAAV